MEKKGYSYIGKDLGRTNMKTEHLNEGILFFHLSGG